MRQMVKKKQAIELIPRMSWRKTGTLTKNPKLVLPEHIEKLITEGYQGVKWKMWNMNLAARISEELKRGSNLSIADTLAEFVETVIEVKDRRSWEEKK